MDDRGTGAVPTRWAVRWSETALAAAGGLTLLGFAATADPAGRLLGLIGAAGLLVLAGTDVVWRPRLVAGAAGLTINAPTHRVTVGWAELREIRLAEQGRWGITARSLEIETGTELIILGRRSLGADPRDVAAALKHAHGVHAAHGRQIPRQGTPPDHPIS